VNSTEKLVMMANQIAANLATEADPVAATANHIRLYWDPHMRGSIRAHKDGLSTIALAAIDQLD
jgi:formate dehydrogenase subunit delta